MKSQHPILIWFGSDWKIVLILALPIFGVAMWYATSNGYTNLGLYAAVLAVASWGVASHAVLVVRKWQEWRVKSRGGP